jgi:starvation-inducible DNA-binding protein
MTQKSEQVHDINIGIENRNRDAVVGILNRVVSDQHLLYTKTRKYHWNVVGRQFHSLHELLEEQYTMIAADQDETAERARSLGGPAVGTMQEYLDCTTLKEDPNQYPEAMQMVQNLVNDHEAVIRNLRNDIDACEEDYDDVGTADFLTELIQHHEKMAWMLRSFLEETAA